MPIKYYKLINNFLIIIKYLMIFTPIYILFIYGIEKHDGGNTFFPVEDIKFNLLNNKFFKIYNELFSATYYRESTYLLNLNTTNSRPIPISVFFIFFYTLYFLLINRFKKKELNFIILVSVLLLTISITKILFFNTDFKLLLYTILFIVPFYGFLVGYYEKTTSNFRAIFLFIFSIIFILIQSTNFAINDFKILSDKFWFFSVYQNQQYFSSTLILLGFYPILTKNDLNLKYKFFLIICMFLYSFFIFKNISTILLFLFGLSLFFLNNLKKKIFIFFLIFILFFIANVFFYSIEIPIYEKVISLKNMRLPTNISERLEIYKIFFFKEYYLFGTLNLNFINKYFSTHNYFLDIYYFFGISPYLLMLFFILKNRKFLGIKKNHDLSTFMIFLVFFIIIENLSKVSLRQFHSGIITFYFIGLIYNTRYYKKETDKL